MITDEEEKQMTQQELARQQSGCVSFKRFQSLKLPCLSRTYGASKATDHTYKNIQISRDPEHFVIFQYTFQGMGELLINGERHKVPSGKAFLLLVPSASIYFQSPETDLYHFIYITLWGDLALEIARKIIMKCGMVLTFRPDSQALEMLCEHFNQLVSSSSSGDIYEEAAFSYAFLLTILKEQENNLLEDKNDMPVRLKNVLTYIDQNLADPTLDCRRLASVAQISIFYLNQLFKRYLFTPPQKYLQAKRLSHAAKLLESDYDLPLKIIIAQCGFFYESHFCYLFKKTYGVSPGEYRKQFLYSETYVAERPCRETPSM